MPAPKTHLNPPLVRRLGLVTLTIYGVGDILGAGIYALVGKVIGIAGAGAWVSFGVAATLAVLTGLTYAELASRIPRAAGAAAFCDEAFGRPLVTFVVGFLVMASGLTSTATVSLAIHAYIGVFFPMPALLSAVGLILVITAIALRGIEASARVNNVLTVLEVSGLVVVITAGCLIVGGGRAVAVDLSPTTGLGPIVAGATLAFYAFIGFEDLANLAEEAKNPKRDLPIAILLAVGISSFIYMTIIILVTVALGPERAGTSSQPLLDLIAASPLHVPARLFSAIAIVAVANTGLTNFVMVSRLLYGLSRQGVIPASLGRVSEKHRTPWVAILTAGGLALLLAATGGVKPLAQTTGLLLVLVFGALHIALVRLRRSLPAPEGIFRAPALVPVLGFLACVFLGSHFPAAAFLRAGVVLIVGVALYFACNNFYHHAPKPSHDAP